MNQTSSISNCSNCGTPREKVDTKFCKKCGMKYNNESFISSDLSPSNTDVQRFICSNSNCSRTFLEGRFCKQCGSRLIKLEEISAFSISQRVTSPPPQRSSSPPSNQRFSSPGPQRPLSVLFGNKEDLKENPEFSFKARTREDRSFSIGTANFNHCSTCNIMGTGKFCNSCGTLFDSVSDLLTTVGTEVKKSSGSEIKARPKRASSLIKSTDVDELLKKIMEDRSNLTDGNLSSSSLPLSSSSPNKLETTSFNQPNEVKYQLTTKSNSSLPLLGGSSQREETKLTSAINEVKLSSSTSNLTDSSTEIPSSLNSSSNENKPTSSRPTINEIKQSLFPEYKLTPSVFSNENKFSNLKSSSTNEIRQNENKSNLTRSSNEIRSSYTPLSASSNEIKPKSTESQIKQNYPSLTSSVEIKPQTIPETSTLKSLSFNDMSTIYKGAPSVLSQSLNDINVLGDGYAVKQYIKNDASFQGLYVSPDPIHAPIIGWLKQNGLDADCFRKTMETLGAKNLDDLKDVLEILEDPNYRNQYGLRIELTPVEFRKLTKAIKTTLENEELKIFPILQNIVLEDKIGEGHFGQVFRGKWGSTTIALKSIGSNKHEFFREANVLIKLRHPNVVLFLGIFNDNGTLYMCTEYVSGGNLIEFLYQRQDYLSTTDLLKIAHSGVSGLIYLSEHKIVHRDIAARNFLITNQEGRFILKVSDFGMSRFFEDYYSSTNKTLPIKWSAIEAIEFKKFSTASDIWSFGIVLWELFEFGKEPYCGMGNSEVIEFLKAQKRLPRPTLCPEMLYQTMLLIWNSDPSKRPKFQDIASVLETLLNQLVPPEEIPSSAFNANGSAFSINLNRPKITPINYVENYNNTYQEPTEKTN